MPAPETDWLRAARSAVAHVFVEDLTSPRLTPDDAHHLGRVLRVRPGEMVSLADGTGGWRLATFKADGTLELAGETVRPEPPAPPITIALAIPKGDRSDWAVQKLTELGVDRIVALSTGRGVVRWDADRAEHHLHRWRAVARQAAMQSRRLRLPVVEGPVSVAEIASVDDGRACLAEPGGPPPAVGRAVVLVGPEGGWTPDERACGLPIVGLTPTILRTETAAVAAATLLAGLRAGVVQPRSHIE